MALPLQFFVIHFPRVLNEWLNWMGFVTFVLKIKENHMFMQDFFLKGDFDEALKILVTSILLFCCTAGMMVDD